MSLAELVARQRRLRSIADEVHLTSGRLLLRGGDVHLTVELLSYAMFRCAEALAIAGETLEDTIEIACRGDSYARTFHR